MSFTEFEFSLNKTPCWTENITFLLQSFIHSLLISSEHGRVATTRWLYGRIVQAEACTWVNK